MTDNEIIKALECCVNNGYPTGCQDCPYRGEDCNETLDADALDLINRQKAEIERLKNGLAISQKETKRILVTKGGRGYGKTRAEAIKEFAERLKEKRRRIADYDEAGFSCQIFVVEEDYIDNLVKEMVGGDNAQ